MLTPETQAFLLHLLNSQQLSVGADDFDEAVAAVQKARRELLALAMPTNPHE